MTPIVVAGIGVLGVIVGALVSAIMTRWSEAVARRRAGYAACVKALVAYGELPYRIRRRTSDNAEELSRLANLGHDIQEDLRCQRAWVRSENRWVGERLDEVVDNMRTHIGPASREAWDLPPVKKASGMNLKEWGPRVAVDIEIARFERAMLNRFGLPWVAGLLGEHPVTVPAAASYPPNPVGR